MNKLRMLVTVSVIVAGLPALARSDATSTVFPDYGAWREVVREPQAQLVSLASVATPVSEEDAARLRERQLEAALEALGIAVD